MKPDTENEEGRPLNLAEAFRRQRVLFWQDDRSYLTRATFAALPCLLLTAVYGLIGPLDITVSNGIYLNYSVTRVVLPALATTLALWLILTAGSALLRGRIFNMWSCLLFGFGLASYIEGGIRFDKLSILDGSVVAWEELGATALKDLFIWLILLLLPFLLAFFLRPLWRKCVRWISALLIFMQLFGLGYALITNPDALHSSDVFSAKDQYTLSSQDNVIVLMLDAASDDAVNVMLQAFPDALDGLNDFTRYTNFTSRYYNTFPGMLYLLTGYPYACDQISWQQYMHDAWTSREADEFYSALKEKNFKVHVFADGAYACGTDGAAMAGKVDNLKRTGAAFEEPVFIGTYLKLVRVSCYRYFPVIAKACFRAYTGDLTEKHNAVKMQDDFWETFEQNGLSLDDSSNYFVFQYLQGLHQPYTMNQFAQEVYGPTECEHACGYFLEISRYLQELKNLGVYDQATIILVADHGRYKNGGGAPYDPKEWPCLFMMKRPMETHEKMVLNAAPVAQDDFLGSVMACVDSGSSLAGHSALKWKEGDRRTRQISIREKDPDTPDTGLHGAFYEYTFEDVLQIDREHPDAVYKIAGPFYKD